jgi:dihydroorotate dehydrogenase (NAD+) catalytic subunit
LNAIGLDNDGIEHFISHHLPYLRTLPTAIVANIAGKSEEEFPEMAGMLANQAGIAALELNLSCPNVTGGTDFATQPAVTKRIVERVRAACSFPILAKLTPNVTDILPIVRAAAEGGADAVTLVNTYLGMAIDWKKRKPILGNQTGGLSGPAIKPMVLRLVWHIARANILPIVAVGGIANVDDVMEFLVAGAQAVQIGTANFYDPSASSRIVGQLTDALSYLRAEQLKDVIGTAHTQLPSNS